ncbi:CFTR inhibitory factor Cif [Micromonospora zhanjiangensis]
MDGARIPPGFTEQTARVGQITINYVRGGQGGTLVLLHGYPQTWFMWRKVLPELAKRYTVIAPDLRGAGGSDAPASGYDKKTLARDVHDLLAQLGLEQDICLVGHDIGTMVAYAYAAAHDDQVSKLVLTEAPIPDQGLYQAPSLTPSGPGLWNFGFFSLPNGLPEQIVAGREELWVDRFTDSMEVQKTGIGADEVAEYARYLQDDAHLRASFEYFRALPQDVADNAEYAKTKLAMPVLALGARASLGDAVPQQAAHYASNVSGGVIEDCGHWIFEERPAELTSQLLEFLQPA